MYRFLYIFLLFTSLSYSQQLVQTFTDRCTGETKVITVALQGTTVVMFYDRVGQFTAEDFTSGVLQAWLEETYQWWYTLSPCSSTQAYTSVVNNATTTATTAVNNINTNSYDTTSQTTSTDTSAATSNTGTENTTSSTENTSSQMDSSQESSGTSTGSGSSNESETGTGETETQTEQQESTSESTEESQQTEEQSQEEETQEQETEESTTEEGTEEESENDDGDGEESEEEVEEKEEEEEEQVENEDEEEDTGKKKKQKKRKFAPPLISANISAMQMVDGAFNSVTSASMTKYSFTGVESYNVGLMMWSNLKQYNLSASKSKTFFNYDRDVPIYIKDEDGKKYQFGSYKDIGSVHKVQTLSANFSSIYSSKVFTFGINDVFISNKEGFWKGFTGGIAGNISLIKAADDFLATPSVFIFGTKPFVTRRFTTSPLLGLSFNPILYSADSGLKLNGNFNYVVGSNFDFQLTKRFRANIGFNTIGNTQKNIPMTYSATIGAKFKL